MKKSQHKTPCTTSCCCSGRTGFWLVLIATTIVVAGVWSALRPRQETEVMESTPATNAAAPLVEAAANLQFLKGRWIRPDGGYVIEIRQVDADGQLDAGYFNPSPIRVVGARATKEGAAVKVHLELNDVNYPGCKYNLTYLPEQRQLVGTYYQAAMQQTYEVLFERGQ